MPPALSAMDVIAAAAPGSMALLALHGVKEEVCTVSSGAFRLPMVLGELTCKACCMNVLDTQARALASCYLVRERPC